MASNISALKALPIICSRQQFQIVLLFKNNQYGMIFPGRGFSCYIKSYFYQKLGKMAKNLSSAAVVIGAFRISKPNVFEHLVQDKNLNFKIV